MRGIPRGACRLALNDEVKQKETVIILSDLFKRIIIRSMRGIPRGACRLALNDEVKQKGNVII